MFTTKILEKIPCDNIDQATLIMVLSNTKPAQEGVESRIFVLLQKGTIKVKDSFLFASPEGLIKSKIKGIWTPVANTVEHFVEHNELSGCCVAYIAADKIESCMAGLPIILLQRPDDLIPGKRLLLGLLYDKLVDILQTTSLSGLFVRSNSLYALKEILNFLNSINVPYVGGGLGSIKRKDVVLLYNNQIKNNSDDSTIVDVPQYNIYQNVLLAFGVNIDHDVKELASSCNVHIFKSDTIYGLFEALIDYKQKFFNNGNDLVLSPTCNNTHSAVAKFYGDADKQDDGYEYAQKIYKQFRIEYKEICNACYFDKSKWAIKVDKKYFDQIKITEYKGLEVLRFDPTASWLVLPKENLNNVKEKPCVEKPHSILCPAQKNDD